MTLYKRNNSQDWFPSIFGEFFNNDWAVKSSTSSPAINVIEDEKGFTVELAAPGMTKDDFSIQLSEDEQLGAEELVISMEKKNESADTAGKKYLRREFSYTKFRQSLLLPDNVDKENISAAVADGVLTVTLPKMTPVQREKLNRTIAIS